MWIMRIWHSHNVCQCDVSSLTLLAVVSLITFFFVLLTLLKVNLICEQVFTGGMPSLSPRRVEPTADLIKPGKWSWLIDYISWCFLCVCIVWNKKMPVWVQVHFSTPHRFKVFVSDMSTFMQKILHDYANDSLLACLKFETCVLQATIRYR